MGYVVAISFVSVWFWFVIFLKMTSLVPTSRPPSGYRAIGTSTVPTFSLQFFFTRTSLYWLFVNSRSIVSLLSV